ncbi:FAD-dependent oxidoreductase [Haloechinothrix sp. YIM 98757]|uniref:FAD-dependent oxidoreductase n=1 Tax=Haloechinothrix aidingensis TaxID=2752311 RepID=A0A838ADX1_9PSEU|nr:FAD-dependent oxidoreductase [Haloechinothrix aidingensis]MBA0127355.1 FAD-dependent oxidoreductase [Haloechinothrix aidingensis]
MTAPSGVDAASTIAVVGTGVAGTSAALTLRNAGFTGRVVLIGDEPDEPYRRPPLSKDVLRGTMPPEKTRLRAPDTWSQHSIELRTGTRVSGVDPEARRLIFADGTGLDFDRILLATGGLPKVLPQARGVDGVHTLRTLADVPALHGVLAAGSRLLVIGAGLIGSEVAATASAMDCAVTVLEAQPAPLSRALPREITRVYEELHRASGVDLYTGVDVRELIHEGDQLAVTDADGRVYSADAAVVAVGLDPRTELAEHAGIATGDGIVVDEYFATSAPGVYAAGDVANHPNHVLGGRQRVEHWLNAQEQGGAAARAMLGDPTPYSCVPWSWSDQHGVTLHVCGWPEVAEDVTVRGELDERDFTAIARRNGRVVGAVGMNRPAELRALRTVVSAAPHVERAVLADPATELASLASFEVAGTSS